MSEYQTSQYYFISLQLTLNSLYTTEVQLDKMKLTDTPNEILGLILYNLDSHTDLYALTRTCKILNTICSHTKLAFHADFKSFNGKYLLPKHPPFVENIAAQLGTWTAASEDNRNLLRATMKSKPGLDHVLNLAGQIAWVTLDELRSAHKAPNTITSFLNKLYAAEKRPSDPDDQHVPPRYSIDAEREILFFVVYCGLFRPDFDVIKKCRNESTSIRTMRYWTRHDFVKYCASDPKKLENSEPSQSGWLPASLALDGLERTKLWKRRHIALARLWCAVDPSLGDLNHLSYSDMGKISFVKVCEFKGWPSLLMLLPGVMKACRKLLRMTRAYMMKKRKVARGCEVIGWRQEPNLFKELSTTPRGQPLLVLTIRR